MCIEDRLHRTAARQAGDRFHQRIGSLRRSTIDQQDTVRADVRDNIRFAGDAHDKQIVAEPYVGAALPGLSEVEGRRPISGLRGGRSQTSNRSAQHNPGGAGDGGL